MDFKNSLRKSIFSLLAVLIISYAANATPISGTRSVGPSGYYSTLTSAISDAVTNGVNGALVLELTYGYNSASETFPIAISNITGASPTNTITIRPQSGISGLSITSSNSTATFDLNGAQYIIIDGRPGGYGVKDLSISNTSLSGAAIRFINDACYNTIMYDTISGVNNTLTGGVIFFSTSTGSRGNDSNIINNCDIKDGATYPEVSIYSLGSVTTSALYNSNNIISNCNIYNFWKAGAESDAFKIGNGNTDWYITGNSVYQTAARTATSAHQQYIINLNNTSGNNFVIGNNYFGGSAPNCGGTAWSVASSVGYRFTGAYFNVGAAAPSLFSNNTFANFNIASGGTAFTSIPGVWSGTYLAGGLINIMGNTFGSTTATGSITITTSITGDIVCPIGSVLTTAGVINIKNNNFGGITTNGTSTSISCGINPIGITTATNVTSYYIDSNVIGNYLPDNIIASNSATTGTQSVYGIINTSTANLIIRKNIIRNLKNNFAGTTNGVTHAIGSNNGIDTVTGNLITNIISFSSSSNGTGSAAVSGMQFNPSTSGNVISNNVIKNLTTANTSAATALLGINSNSNYNTIFSNWFYGFNSLSSASTAKIIGINVNGGAERVYNNMIILGFDSTGTGIPNPILIIGINRQNGNISAFHNSVFIGGYNVSSGSANSSAMNRPGSGFDTIMN
ncbi:MAG: beta strand repeat-containing protein, partial [Bacteroidia bacterium]